MARVTFDMDELKKLPKTFAKPVEDLVEREVAQVVDQVFLELRNKVEEKLTPLRRKLTQKLIDVVQLEPHGEIDGNIKIVLDLSGDWLKEVYDDRKE